MGYGYCGRVLHVDLTKGAIEVEKPPENFYRQYLGGTAMGVYYLLKHMPPGADPLGPDNILTVFVSVPTGAPVSGLSRVTVNARSPLTGTVGDAQAGGFWPVRLKAAGYDGIVFTGRAAKPLYLWVDDDRVELRDASHLWGKVTGEVEDMLRDELGDKKIEVMQIGPAGEKQVKYACIINMKSRANGRTGMGAVMGSKHLKAIAVRGSGKINVWDKAPLTALAKAGARWIEEEPGIAGMRQFGTGRTIAVQHKLGGLPTRNWTSGVFEEGWETTTGETISEQILKDTETCYGCIVRCKRVVEVTAGPMSVDPQYGGPEYETLSALGSYCAVSDLVAIAKANELCNKYGLDTITAGGVISFAMECFENGLLSLQDTGGIDLRFGNAQAMVKMVEMICKREGLGDLLAEGPEVAAAQIGNGAEHFSVSTKNQPLPAHMPQNKRALGLIYAINPYGADHQSCQHDHQFAPDVPEFKRERIAALGLYDPMDPRTLEGGKIRFAYYTHMEYNLLNSLNACHFCWGDSWQLYSLTQLVEMLRAVTGWDVSLWELIKAGERAINMMRVFNALQGIDSRQDRLPDRIFEPLHGGPTDGLAVTREEIETGKKRFYAMAGWDECGVPTRAKLNELDLAWAADLLAARPS